MNASDLESLANFGEIRTPTRASAGAVSGPICVEIEQRDSLHGLGPLIERASDHEYIPDAPDLAEWIYFAVEMDNRAVFVSYEGGSPTGLMLLEAVRGNAFAHPTVVYLYADPTCRSARRVLVAALDGWAEANGYNTIQCCTRPDVPDDTYIALAGNFRGKWKGEKAASIIRWDREE